MANININLTEVRKQAKLLKEASSQLMSGTVKPMEEANEKMSSAWTGNSASAFTKYMEELKAALKSNADDISKISTFLTNACTSIEKADREAKAKIK
ncbi:MAG: WXG100 family type VII secretion target [Lachnospiraceae bacterium]|nr:WXG100 family type VII secretion target [Lachnospiraceae bacterium]MCR5768078.1 WXG100 family type VII secretion target [Lachnospiraceae bacterium]